MTDKPARKRSKKSKPSRVVVESRTQRGVYYQLELVRCGKAACKACKAEATHGPYWYAYRKSGDRWVSKYVGRMLLDQNPFSLRGIAKPRAKRRTKNPLDLGIYNG